MVDKNKKSGLKKFFQENRSLVFTIPVFIVLVVVVILVYVLSGDKPAVSENQTPAPTSPPATAQPAAQAPAATSQPTDSDSEGTEVTTLPQSERDKDDFEIKRNPFADPYKVSGIIYEKSGNSIAIIEAENKTYIVEPGDEIDGYFKVLNIDSDRVVLEIDGMEVELTLSGE